MGDIDNRWWTLAEGSDLAQGDYMLGCAVPFFRPDYGPGQRAQTVEVREYDCIVVTQSCDLANKKAPLVALCPMVPLSKYEEMNPTSTRSGAWEQVRQGRVEGLHLLASMETPQDNRACFVVDFHEIYSLPVPYLQGHASRLGRRWRLRSPFLEHFSQAFARFFMRVGLPSSILPYR